jgi:hypothetical protein
MLDPRTRPIAIKARRPHNISVSIEVRMMNLAYIDFGLRFQ